MTWEESWTLESNQRGKMKEIWNAKSSPLFTLKNVPFSMTQFNLCLLHSPPFCPLCLTNCYIGFLPFSDSTFKTIPWFMDWMSIFQTLAAAPRHRSSPSSPSSLLTTFGISSNWHHHLPSLTLSLHPLSHSRHLIHSLNTRTPTLRIL